MNKLINAVIGDNKKSSPARKYTAYALLGTLIIFLVLVIVLIASSVFFAVRGEGTPAVGEDNPNGGTVINTGSISYETVTADVLDGKIAELVSVQENRTKFDDAGHKFYYAATRGTMLRYDVAKAVDNMLVKFYNSSNGSVDPYTGEDNKRVECTIPLIVNADTNGYKFSLVVFGNDQSINGNSTYKWIFDNAYSYGFVYTENAFTYVGVAVANYIRVTSSVTNYTQFLTAVKGANNNLNTSVKDTATNKSVSYQIYYLAKGGVLNVPTNYEYTVIPDGDNGYVITVNTSEPIIDGVG